MTRPLTPILLAILLCLTCTACKKTQNDVGSEQIDLTPALDRALDPLRKTLAGLPPGADILTEDEYKPLVPPSMNALDFYSYYKLYRYPDSRIDPFAADYILVHDSIQVDALCAPPGIWQRHTQARSSAGRMVCLLKRNAHLDESILAAVPDSIPDAMTPIKGGLIRHPSPGGQPVETDVKDFRIDTYEVTHSQFTRFLNEKNISPTKLDPFYSLKDPASKIVYFQGRYRHFKGYENLPVFNVSYFGAKSFCEHYGKRLPGNAEWYQAAGRGDGRIYPWGNQTDFENRANFRGDKDGYLLWAPVDAFEQGKSPFGVYNLSGNMYEWTESANLIGGCFELEPKEGRLDALDQNEMIARNLHDGFRCVK